MNQKKLSYSSIARKVLLPFVAIMTIVLVVLWNGKSAEAAYAPTIGAAGGTLSYGIDNGCTVTENCDWFSISRPSATKINVNVADNPYFQPRTGYVYVKKGGKTVRTITITQQGNYVIFATPGEITIGGDASWKTYTIYSGSKAALSVTSKNSWLHVTVNNSNIKQAYGPDGIVYSRTIRMKMDDNLTGKTRTGTMTFFTGYSIAGYPLKIDQFPTGTIYLP